MADIRINALATTATTPASDDYLALDGTAQGTRKILATNIANNVTDVILGDSGPSVKSTLSARAPRQGLVFDGTSVATVGTISAFGTSDFSVSAIIVPKSSVGAQQTVFMSAAGGFYLAIKTDGTIGIAISGAGFTVSSTGSVAFDKASLITYTRSGTTGTFYINGVSAGTATDTNNYSQPINQLNYSGAVQFFGLISGIAIYNRALSASEVVSLYEAGAPSGADYATPAATNTSLNDATAVQAFNTFTSFTGASATGFTGVKASGYAGAIMGKTGGFAVTKGQRIRVAGNLTLNNGKTVKPGLAFTNSNGTAGYSANTVISAAGAFSVEITATETQSAVYVLFQNTGDQDYTVDSVAITRIGLLLAPDAAQAGNGYVWNDQSGNLAQIVLPSSGVQWNLPSVATNRIRGTTSTNGNQQLLGASVLLPAECQITHVRARARSGTPTITIGTASGGAQIVASVALSTTWLNCTIALIGGIVSSADDIWIGSNSTDVVETDIAFQPLDF